MSKAVEALESILGDTNASTPEQLEAARLLLNHETNVEGLRIHEVEVNANWQKIDRSLKIDEARLKADGSGSEIDRLAEYLYKNFRADIEGSAVDTAIKIIDELSAEEDDDA